MVKSTRELGLWRFKKNLEDIRDGLNRGRMNDMNKLGASLHIT